MKPEYDICKKCKHFSWYFDTQYLNRYNSICGLYDAVVEVKTIGPFIKCGAIYNSGFNWIGKLSLVTAEIEIMKPLPIECPYELEHTLLNEGVVEDLDEVKINQVRRVYDMFKAEKLTNTFP